MKEARLKRMANDIARNLAAQGEGAAAAITDHLLHFWAPRMREELLAMVDAGSEGLERLVVEAAAKLRASG